MERIWFKFQINIVLSAICQNGEWEANEAIKGPTLNWRINVKYLVEFPLNSYVFWKESL